MGDSAADKGGNDRPAPRRAGAPRGGPARAGAPRGGDRREDRRRDPREDRRRDPRDPRDPQRRPRSTDRKPSSELRHAAVTSSPAVHDQGPPLPEEFQADDLDRGVRAELRAISRPTADTVSRRLVAAGSLLAENPAEALAHALAARRSAPRIGVVREAVGLAAYRTGEWQLAIAEMRAYHRITGSLSHIGIIADCERALGRPERAVDLYRKTDRGKLTRSEAVELLIVAAAARRDLGQIPAAAAMLQVPELDSPSREPAIARLRYAYADALLAAGRHDEARHWFAQAVAADEDTETDAAERLLELEGVQIDGVQLEGSQPDETELDGDDPTRP